MIEVIEYKWIIASVSETLAWILTALMGYFRYWAKSKQLFWMSTVLAVFFGWIVHIAMMIMDYINGGSLSWFSIAIIVLFIFGLTYGEKLIKKMDASIQKWCDEKRMAISERNNQE